MWKSNIKNRIVSVIAASSLTVAGIGLVAAPGFSNEPVQLVAVPDHNHLVPSSDLIGSDVKNSKGEEVGELYDIVLLNDTGEIPYAVVSFGGIFGPDDLFAIPWKALTHDHRDGVCVLNVSMLSEEPEEGENRDWLELDDEAEDDEYGHETEPALGEYWLEEPSPEAANKANQSLRHQTAALSMNHIVGATVLSGTGEEVGTIHDVIIDVQTGKTASVVFAAGGFLGLGEDRYVCPWKTMTYSREEGTVTTNLTHEKLRGLPKYEEE